MATASIVKRAIDELNRMCADTNPVALDPIRRGQRSEGAIRTDIKLATMGRASTKKATVARPKPKDSPASAASAATLHALKRESPLAA
jgi:hypothetical protein